MRQGSTVSSHGIPSLGTSAERYLEFPSLSLLLREAVMSLGISTHSTSLVTRSLQQSSSSHSCVLGLPQMHMGREGPLSFGDLPSSRLIPLSASLSHSPTGSFRSESQGHISLSHHPAADLAKLADTDHGGGSTSPFFLLSHPSAPLRDPISPSLPSGLNG